MPPAIAAPGQGRDRRTRLGLPWHARKGQRTGRGQASAVGVRADRTDGAAARAVRRGPRSASASCAVRNPRRGSWRRFVGRLDGYRACCTGSLVVDAARAGGLAWFGNRRGRSSAHRRTLLGFAAIERAASGVSGGGSMKSPDTAGTNGRPAWLPGQPGVRSELDQLRATCRSQALTTDALGQAVAENAELRAEPDRLRGGRRGQGGASGRLDAGAALAVRLPCDVRAPGAARIVVAHCLRGRVAPGVLDNAQLLVSELVTNSVRHGGTCAADDVVVRVRFTRTLVRLEIEDAGRGGVVVPRPPDLDSGGGFGLRLVQALSQRWGLERVAQV